MRVCVLLYCSTMRENLADKIAKDIRSVHRTVEKYQERYSQRKAKFLRPVQEKLVKEKLVRAKLIRETTDKHFRPAISKIYAKFDAEIAGTIASIGEKIRLGDEDFAQCISSLSDSPDLLTGLAPAEGVVRRVAEWLRSENVRSSCNEAGTAPVLSIGAMMDELTHYFAYG
jgi:hypothetical protein